MSNKSVLRPLGDRIVVERDQPETKTAGGLHLPQSATSNSAKPVRGTVVAVGQGKTLQDGSLKPLSVAVGDRVVFGKQAVQEVEVDGDTFVIVRQDDLIAVIEAG